MCPNFNTFEELTSDDKDYKVTVLRADAEGRLVFHDMIVTRGQAKILLYDLTVSE